MRRVGKRSVIAATWLALTGMAGAEQPADGERLLQERRYRDAAETFAGTARSDPGRPELWFKAASAWRRAGLCRDAIPAYRRYLEARPDEPETLYGLGFCLRDTGDLSGAATALRGYLDRERSPEAAPFRDKVRVTLGDVLFLLGRPREALSMFEEAVKARPDSADDWYSLAFALRSVERHADAIDAYRRYLVLRPESVDAYYGLGRSYAALGRGDEARDMLARYLELAERTSDGDLWQRRARALLLGLQPSRPAVPPPAIATPAPGVAPLPAAAPAPGAPVFKPAPPPTGPLGGVPGPPATGSGGRSPPVPGAIRR